MTKEEKQEELELLKEFDKNSDDLSKDVELDEEKVKSRSLTDEEQKTLVGHLRVQKMIMDIDKKIEELEKKQKEKKD